MPRSQPVLKFYATSALWMGVLLAAAAIMLTLGSVLYTAFDLEPTVRAALTVSIAIAAASVSAAALWWRLGAEHRRAG